MKKTFIGRVPLRLFGRSADYRPMKEAAEWRLLDGGCVQVVDERTGLVDR